MLDFSGEILILTGPPGSGKTTTGEALAHFSGSPKVHLHSDLFWGFIKNSLVAPWLPEARHQNETIMSAVARTADSFAQGGYFVVLDGVIGPWFLDKFLDLNLPIHYVVLRPPLEDAIQRCQRRGGDTLADPGPITDLHRQFGDLGELERHVIHTDGLSREEQMGRVVKALMSGAYRLETGHRPG